MSPTPQDFQRQRTDPKNPRSAKGKVWLWRDNPRISIRERVNASGGIGYRVTFPVSITGGEVLFMQSRDFAEACEMARSRGREFRESRATARVLGEAQKLQAASGLRTLAAEGIDSGLDLVATEYAAAKKELAVFGYSLPEAAKLLARVLRAAEGTGKNLDEVVRYATIRLKPAGGLKTVSELTSELCEIKAGWHKRGQLRHASLRDFESRTGRIRTDLGELSLPELTKTVIQQWLEGLNLSPRSAKNYRMILAELCRYAVQKRYLAESPIDELTRHDVKQIEGRAESARQPSILSPSQAETLIRIAFAKPELDLGAAVTLGLFAGIRTEELKRLRWDAVRLNDPHPFVVIGPEIAKKRRIRNVPLPDCAVAWLQRWPRKEGKVTRSEHENDFQKRFKKLCNAAKIAWENNAMRHSFGSYHYAKHGNSVETARVLGHKADDTVLFSHYRALASKEHGDAYFAIMPAAESNIEAFPGQLGHG
ncbi:MAG: hypothetical protein EXS43_06640 [Opitutus sp.]|nr:hypothetical protein [Opitutus sp.]